VRVRNILVSLCFLSVAACSAPTAPTPERAPRAAEPAHKERLASELRRDLARFSDLESTETARPYDVQSYSLEGSFDWSKLVLDAAVTIRLRLLDEAATTLELDSRVARISSVTLASGATPDWSYDPAAALLSVNLGDLTPAARAQELALTIRYTSLAHEPSDYATMFDPRALRAVKAREGDPVKARTLNTMSEPRSAAQWMPCNDRPSDRATFSMKMTLPRKA
jgi:aminopeptidase N